MVTKTINLGIRVQLGDPAGNITHRDVRCPLNGHNTELFILANIQENCTGVAAIRSAASFASTSSIILNG